QLEPGFDYDNVYVEFKSYLPKVNGRYMVPEVAFETLVEWTKFKSIQGKSNFTTYDKNWQLEQYKRERGNMEKAANKASLRVIVDYLRSVPKFELTNIE
ncbi:MAG TPA: hypothetical protein VJ279_14075, partial [Hanamia sp.]|nr:hypothetical protein [Hanamia sp.]